LIIFLIEEKDKLVLKIYIVFWIHQKKKFPKFYLYKKAIGIIADYHKVNPTKAGIIAVESYANKLIGN